MKSFTLYLALGLALAAACGGKTTSGGASTSPTEAADDPSCPLLVPGTSVSVENTESGAALVFVTTGDPLAVCARAAALAEMHSTHAGPRTAMGMMFERGSTATATEVDGGARVEFAAASPDKIASVQQELRMHASHSPAAVARCDARDHRRRSRRRFGRRAMISRALARPRCRRAHASSVAAAPCALLPSSRRHITRDIPGWYQAPPGTTAAEATAAEPRPRQAFACRCAAARSR
jgi:hypothetical protein